jgi:hypothetical protein
VSVRTDSRADARARRWTAGARVGIAMQSALLHAGEAAGAGLSSAS